MSSTLHSSSSSLNPESLFMLGLWSALHLPRYLQDLTQCGERKHVQESRRVCSSFRKCAVTKRTRVTESYTTVNMIT